MKPSAFQYHRPATVSEAVQLLGTLDNAKLLAGGQSLMPMMNFRAVMADHVIDLNGIAELSGISLRDGRLHIGDTVEVAPGGVTARVRGLQTHRHEVQEAQPGTRVAVNLAGVAVEDLARGQVIAPAGSH